MDKIKPNQIWIPRLKKFKNSKFFGCKVIRLIKDK